MNGPRKKGRRPCRAALPSTETNLEYSQVDHFQASLQHRLNRVVAVGEIMPTLFARILAKSFLPGRDRS
jgi:hypothetical protein